MGFHGYAYWLKARPTRESLDFTQDNPGVLSPDTPWVSQPRWDSEAGVTRSQAGRVWATQGVKRALPSRTGKGWLASDNVGECLMAKQLHLVCSSPSGPQTRLEKGNNQYSQTLSATCHIPLTLCKNRAQGEDRSPVPFILSKVNL